LQINLPGTHRYWLTFRTSTNPITPVGGPVPRIGLPLEARLTEKGVEIQILRLAFDLTLGSTVVGQGEIGPLMYLHTDEHYFMAWATCPQTALPYLINPSPPQGRVDLKRHPNQARAAAISSSAARQSPRHRDGVPRGLARPLGYYDD